MNKGRCRRIETRCKTTFLLGRRTAVPRTVCRHRGSEWKIVCRLRGAESADRPLRADTREIRKLSSPHLVDSRLAANTKRFQDVPSERKRHRARHDRPELVGTLRFLATAERSPSRWRERAALTACCTKSSIRWGPFPGVAGRDARQWLSGFDATWRDWPRSRPEPTLRTCWRAPTADGRTRKTPDSAPPAARRWRWGQVEGSQDRDHRVL